MFLVRLLGRTKVQGGGEGGRDADTRVVIIAMCDVWPFIPSVRKESWSEMISSDCGRQQRLLFFIFSTVA